MTQDWKEWFEEDKRVNGTWGEDMYQAFKQRMIEEMKNEQN